MEKLDASQGRPHCSDEQQALGPSGKGWLAANAEIKREQVHAPRAKSEQIGHRRSRESCLSADQTGEHIGRGAGYPQKAGEDSGVGGRQWGARGTRWIPNLAAEKVSGAVWRFAVAHKYPPESSAAVSRKPTFQAVEGSSPQH